MPEGLLLLRIELHSRVIKSAIVHSVACKHV